MASRTRFALETKLLGDAHPDSSEVPGTSSSSPEDLARGSQKGSPRLGLLRERDERSVSRHSRGLRARKHSPGSSPSPSRGASAASELDPQEPHLTDISMSEAGDEPSGRSGQHRHHAARSHHRPKKSGGTSASVLPQTWLRISSVGETTLLGDPSEKHRTTRALGLQARDLRVLDPKLSTTYPSAILYREKAILVNIEFVKAIIAMDFVVVVNPSDENVPAFIAELVNALGSATAQGLGEKARSYTALTDVASKLKGTSNGIGIELPFELKALEVCLDTIASHLDKAGGDLESTAYPILDSLSGKVSERRLERVRVLKNRLVRLTNRVTMVRQLLERFLENDEDMHKLSLTALEASRQASMEEAEHAGSNISTATSSTHSANSSDIAEVAEVEMLLEAYFMHLDNTFNRLQTLNEYVGDTEDLVNIKLDSHRNRLMTVNVMLIAFTTALSFVVALTGLFAMNLDNASTDAHEHPLSQVSGAFDAVTISGCSFAIAFFGAFVLWCKRKNLIL